MKFFDKLFKAIGFDEREFEQEEENLGEGKNLKKKRENVVLPNAKFNLKEKRRELLAKSPQTQEEIESLVLLFKEGEELSINLEKFDEEDKTRVLDFLFGAAFALGGSLKKTGENSYLMVSDEDWKKN